MLSINNFGMSLVIDHSTNIVVFSSTSNEVSKFITSSLLDTYVYQLANHYSYDPQWFVNALWIKNAGRGKFILWTDIPADIIEKRKVALILAKGYWLLLGQTAIIGSAFDHLSELNSENLPMYIMMPNKYAEEYALATGKPVAEARMHLSFLAESLISVHFRKQSLMWKYGAMLKEVVNEEMYSKWKEELLKETIWLGHV